MLSLPEVSGVVNWVCFVVDYTFLSNPCYPCAGLIADRTGSYVYSFYMTGGVLLAAFLIPMMLIVIRYRSRRVQSSPPEHERSQSETDQESIKGDSNAGAGSLWRIWKEASPWRPDENARPKRNDIIGFVHNGSKYLHFNIIMYFNIISY